MDIQEAIKVLTNELENDESYRIAWESNIAMAFKDSWSSHMGVNSDCIPFSDLHSISNHAARYFISLLCMKKGNGDIDLPGMLALNLGLENSR